MADIFTEITTQSISAFIGGGAVAVIPPLTQLIRRRRRGARRPDAATRDLVIFAGSSLTDPQTDSIRGDDSIRVNNSRHIDNRSIVINNIRDSGGAKGAASSDGSTENVWLIVFAMLAAAALFANYYVIVSWFALGLGMGIAVIAALGVIRAVRWRLWDRGAAIALAEATLAIVAVIWTWVAVFTSERRGSTLESLRVQMAAEIARASIDPGPTEWMQRHLLAPITAFMNVAIANGQLVFVVSLFGAFVMSSIVMLLVWVRLYNWYVYLGFLFGVAGGRAAKRAQRHADLAVVDLGIVLLLAALTVFFASGFFVTMADAGASAGG